MFVHAPRGTFTPEASAAVAAALTDLGIACERLVKTPAVRAGVWVYFTEHEPAGVFRGGQVAQQPVTTLQVYALAGGLDPASKKRLITEATKILIEHASDTTSELPVYAAILEVPETNWGMYGKPVSLAAMQA